MKAKRSNLVRKILRIAIVFILALLIMNMAYGMYKENQISLKKESNQNIVEKSNILIASINNVDIPDTYKGFNVIATLEAPTIGLDTNVLEKYTTEGLKVCASKYWGPEPNEVGNFCIAGHNYDEENMFNHLIDLQIGDILYLTDEEHGKCKYKIYDIYRVKPQNTEPLSQDTENVELTLITCVNYSRNRLIVKAVQTNEI